MDNEIIMSIDLPTKRRVICCVQDINESLQVVPIPPNIDTVNKLFGTDIQTEQDMIDWLDQRRPKVGNSSYFNLK